MVLVDMGEIVERYVTAMMNAGLTYFLDTKPYKRRRQEVNHDSGCYGRNFTAGGIGRLKVTVAERPEGRIRDVGSVFE